MTVARAEEAGQSRRREGRRPRKVFAHDKWMESIGIPIHRGYYIEDLRTIDLGWWPEREANCAFVQLNGLEGVSEVRVTEIPPGKSLRPWRMAVDESIYVLEGRGLTSVWIEEKGPRKTFEWGKGSLFMIPRHFEHVISNTQGDRPVRLMHFNHLPIAMSVIEDASFFFNNPLKGYDLVQSPEEAYSEAKLQEGVYGMGGSAIHWYGNFFPDMASWDKLTPNRDRGAGGYAVFIQFANSGMSCHMSVFQPQLYKKAHRHGPGRAIVIPAGEGYSILWEEGQEKVVVPWHEGTLLTPPNRWFHQHFNLGSVPARYLALHPLAQFSGHAERAEDRARDTIEYAHEEPWVREMYEAELAKRGLQSIMPDECYRDPDYKWAYAEDGD